jgi:pimeloyl-ACP methyl ester carboxylesterase
MALEERPVPRFTQSGVEYLDFGAEPNGTVVFAHGFRDSAHGWIPVGFKRIRIGAIHGAGHYPHLERPVELAGLIARFLPIPAPPTIVETRVRSESRS